MSFPIVLEQSDAIGQTEGQTVRASTITAAALILVSRGVDRILVPVPGSYESERAEEGIDSLPSERRDIVKLIDKDGEVLRRVRDYLEPLSTHAVKWPETAFVSFLESFVYHVALGARHRSAVASTAVQVVRGFIPIIDPSSFRGEARFRLAEIASLICSYEPHAIDHGSLRAEVSAGREMASTLWNLIETAEFRSMVAATGKLGYLDHPIITLRRVRNIVRDFLQMKDAKTLLKVIGTVADIGSKTGGPVAAIKTSTSVLANLADLGEPFRPPFLDLGPSVQGIYRASLSSRHPDAIPPSGTIFVFEQSRAGHRNHSWLSVGEELKLEREAGDIRGAKQKYDEAIAALSERISL
jgi:hypothetical protein